jgi:hypothetical protein
LSEPGCIDEPPCPLYTYDALGRLLRRSNGIDFVYNGDGTLVRYGSTNYTQDLAAPLSQILADGTNTYVYGMDRLYGVAGSTRSWYTADALGSVRAITSNAGTPSAVANYDPYGGLQGSAIGSFGYTGDAELAEAQYDSSDTNGKDLSDGARTFHQHQPR